MFTPTISLRLDCIIYRQSRTYLLIHPPEIKSTMLVVSLRAIFIPYFLKKISWSASNLMRLIWELFCPVYKKWAKKKLDWIHKYTTLTLPCGTRFTKQHRDDPTYCGLPLETVDHIF